MPWSLAMISTLRGRGGKEVRGKLHDKGKSLVKSKASLKKPLCQWRGNLDREQQHAGGGVCRERERGAERVDLRPSVARAKHRAARTARYRRRLPIAGDRGRSKKPFIVAAVGRE